jgi:hypothetical protein
MQGCGAAELEEKTILAWRCGAAEEISRCGVYAGRF